MPSPRELQPYLSAAINQAVMRGMAVESRFRPATVAEWLQLLPGSRLEMTPQLLTQPAPTIDLSALEAENQQKQPAPIPAATPSPVGKVTVLPKKIFSSKAFVSVSVALVAMTAGFTVTRMLPKSQSQAPKPLFEQPLQEPATPQPVVETTPSLESQDNQNQSSSESASFSTSERRKRKRNFSPEPTPTNESVSPEISPEQENSSELTPGKNQQTTSTPVVTPTPSLVEKIREAKSSPQPTPPPEKEKENISPPAIENNNSAQPEKPEEPVVIPTAAPQPKNSVVVPTTPPKQSESKDSSAVVVPTQETNSKEKNANAPANNN
jgi:serine/threonine-protein kinase